MSGGYEVNHFSSFKNVAALRGFDAWQQSGLLGLSKKMPVKSKYMKGTKIQVLYDFLWRQHVPVGKEWVVRLGYTIK